MTKSTSGILLKLLNISLFITTSFLFKSLSWYFGVPEMCFVAMILGSILTFPIALKVGFSMKSSWLLYLFRAFANALGITTWIYAISKIGINEASAISYITPIITTILGILICKERLNYKYIIATLTGFIGVYISLKPSFNIGFVGAASIIISCFSWAFHDIICKKQSGTEHSIVQAFHSFWIGIIFLAPVALYNARFGHYISHYYILTCIAVLSTINVVVIFLAYKFAPITLLMPFSYCRFPITCIVTYVLYGYTPSLESIIGSCIIACSSIFVFLQRKKNS
ncbi:EamA family transporter [Candidatus Cyrtobacter comes]|uniref:S-adenosylmethionine uptake transporter n=1 Tax=Candidatus Cyrtobacter comes TaxID=675776 RepID=A0ABU5L7S4_9RICK|nr:DMT family transporter [Candidatus Cyrtobacter comes]MDZ5762169.1 EamA family transporter [Candidatus Cyrtobacter comes]